MSDFIDGILDEAAANNKWLYDMGMKGSSFRKWENMCKKKGIKKDTYMSKYKSIVGRISKKMKGGEKKNTADRNKSISKIRKANPGLTKQQAEDRLDMALYAAAGAGYGFIAAGPAGGVGGALGAVSGHRLGTYIGKKIKSRHESGVISSNESYSEDDDEMDELIEIASFKEIPVSVGPKGIKLKLRENFEFPVKDPGFSRAVTEFFDMKDNNTRVVMVSVNEEDQSRILTSLTGRLYDMIVDKANEIDFGEIPKTRGDIELLPNYDKLEECIEVIDQLLTQYKQDRTPIVTIEEAIENVKQRRDLFKKGYILNCEMPIFVYNTVVLAIISSVSLMISTCIEFIKNPKDANIQASLDKVGLNKSKNSLLFDNLKRFNKMCKSKDLDKALTLVMKNGQHELLGTSIGTVAAITAGTIILFNILPMLRELTYFFFYTRTRISDYFNLQADLLQLNAENLKAPDASVTQDDRKKVIKRQLSIAERFRKLADFFMIDAKSSEIKTDADIKATEKKLKADDVLDSLPDSTASSLF